MNALLQLTKRLGLYALLCRSQYVDTKNRYMQNGKLTRKHPESENLCQMLTVLCNIFCSICHRQVSSLGQFQRHLNVIFQIQRSTQSSNCLYRPMCRVVVITLKLWALRCCLYLLIYCFSCFFHSEELRAANVIADDVKGVDCLVLERQSVTAAFVLLFVRLLITSYSCRFLTWHEQGFI